MVSTSAYASWLSQREHKIYKPPARSSLSGDTSVAPPASKAQPKADVTQQHNDYKAASSVFFSTDMEEGPRKRPHGIGSTASRLAALRSIKRRLGESSRKKRRRGDATGSNINSRAVTRVTSSERQNQGRNCPVLLEESNYWLTVQRFSQF
ncbi:hypothetical protein P3T76_011584 [Phytophthora citrophthora]|uniref:Uncharacterized protein n=1 Tax=Phytophthora citrophthora TaxID=4793 RepID=A0AAD9G8Q0_9STRA|nr:hypothetical protein P3T76_011584 [Phytophthora citrophthora]